MFSMWEVTYFVSRSSVPTPLLSSTFYFNGNPSTQTEPTESLEEERKLLGGELPESTGTYGPVTGVVQVASCPSLSVYHSTIPSLTHHKLSN